MIDIDITMPIQILNILFLIVVMNIVLYRPVRKILDERQNKITTLSKDIETFDKNAKLRLEDFEQKLSEARSKAKAQFEGLRSEAQASGNEVIGNVRKEAEATKAEQFKELDAQFAAAQTELKGQIDTFAGEMASKVLGRAL